MRDVTWTEARGQTKNKKVCGESLCTQPGLYNCILCIVTVIVLLLCSVLNKYNVGVTLHFWIKRLHLNN